MTEFVIAGKWGVAKKGPEESLETQAKGRGYGLEKGRNAGENRT
jgi:hypothetical protein